MASSMVVVRSLRWLLALTVAAALALLPAMTGSAATPSDPAGQIAALNQKLDKAVEVYDQARITVGRSAARQKVLRAQVKVQQRNVATAKVTVSSFASSAYKAGGLTPMASLLDSGSPQNFLDEMATLNRLSRDQRRSLDQLVGAERTLAAQQREIGAELATQRSAEKTAADTKVQLQRDLAKAQQLAKAEQLAKARAAQAQAAQAQAAKAHAAQAQAAKAQATKAQAQAPKAQAQAAKAQAQAANAPPATSGRPPAPSRPTAPPSASPTPAPPPPPTGPVSGSAATAVRFAYAQLGKPYGWGAAGPGAYDCSGLTMASWRAGGVSLPHSSEAQYGSSPHVSLTALQPGDLIFYGSPIHHVAIYIGGGQVIHAPVPGEVVRIAPMDLEPPVGAVRP